MGNRAKAAVGFVAIAGSITSIPTVSAADIGDSVSLTVGTATIQESFGGFSLGNVGSKTCVGTALDDNNSFSTSFRVEVPADCFDDYLVSGEGYGSLVTSFNVVTSPISVPGRGQVALPAELTDPAYLREINGSDGSGIGDNARASLFDSSRLTECSNLVFEVPGDQDGPVFQGLDLTCTGDPGGGGGGGGETNFCGNAAARYRSAVLEDSPLHFWTFDDSTDVGADEVGGLDLSGPGLVGSTALLPGDGGGLRMGGIGDGPQTASIAIPDAFTVEFWTELDDGQHLVFFGDTTFVQTDFAGDEGPPVELRIGGQSVVANGVAGVRHIAYQYAEGSASLFLDGELVGSTAVNPANLPSSGPISIFTDGFDGRYDDLAVYDEAVSAGQIAAHFDATVTGADCEGGDPLGFGIPLTTDALTVEFRSDPIDGTRDQCVLRLDTEAMVCFLRSSDAAEYVELIEAGTSFAQLGIHFVEPIASGPAIYAIGATCSFELSLNGSAWNELISSTRSDCASIEHWTEFDGGTPPVGLTGDVETIPIGPRTILTDVVGDVSGIRYSNQPVEEPIDQFVYVALGDSFASGEGTDRFSTVAESLYETGVNYPEGILTDNTLTGFFGGNACHRSLINYAKINENLLEPALESVLIDRTCSGALAEPEGNEGDQPPIVNTSWFGDGDPSTPPSDFPVETWSQANQAVWVLDQRGLDPDDVDLITVSMGGNDSGFASLIESCISARVSREAIETVSGVDVFLEGRVADFIASKLPRSCEATDDARGLDSTANLIAGGNGRRSLSEKIRTAHQQLVDQFPNATILQINYPAFLPVADNFPVDDNCSGIHPADADYALSRAALINNTIETEIFRSNSIYANEFRIVDVSQRFGPNALCPEGLAAPLANSIPEGAVQRIVNRIFDSSQEPGSLIDDAFAVGAFCAFGSFEDPAASDEACDELSERVDAVADWFVEGETPTGEPNLEVIFGLLGGADPGVAPADQDGAGFENLRGLFHPNELGFSTIACNVRAVYLTLNQTDCDNPLSVSHTYALNGNSLTSSEPTTVAAGESVTAAVNGWMPGTDVEIWLRSDPVLLTSVVADSNGLADVSVVIPAETPGGIHQLHFVGQAVAGQQRRVNILIDVPGQPVLGESYSLFVDDLGPYEVAEVQIDGLAVGFVEADSQGHGVATILVPLDADTSPPTIGIAGASSQAVVLTDAVPPELPPTSSICDGLVPTIEGTDASETINGTSGDDIIFAYAGDDKINGKGGDDIVCAGPGNDTINLQDGDDTVDTGPGNDKVNAKNGTNIVYALEGDNVINGGAGIDTVFAGPGDDRANTKSGDDVIDLGDGDNFVSASNGDDTVTTGSGADVLNLGSGNDTAHAGGGDDRINAGSGTDTANGGEGIDTCFGEEEAISCEN